MDEITINVKKPSWRLPRGSMTQVRETIVGLRKRVLELESLASKAPRLDLPEDAAQTYLSTQGVLRVPDHIRKALRLPGGTGGVVFIEENDEVKLLSDDQYLDKLGLDPDDDER